MLRSTLCSAAVTLLAASSAMGQFLDDGNFDDLDPGTPPNCDTYAGAWGWPQIYLDNLLCERLPPECEIVLTKDRGNSLHLNVDDPDINFNVHLTNVLREVIDENPTHTVVFTAEVKVVNDGVGGGCLYVGGDHGGGGFSNVSDRGPQICWLADGTIQAFDGATNPIVVEGYPFDEWQTVRIRVDLTNDRYDLYWGPDAEHLTLAAAGVQFRSPTLTFVDRITVAHFGGVSVRNEGLFDSFDIKDICNADVDESGDIGFDDLLAVLAAWGPCDEDCPEDIDGSGTVGFDDLLLVLAGWGPCE